MHYIIGVSLKGLIALDARYRYTPVSSRPSEMRETNEMRTFEIRRVLTSARLKLGKIEYIEKPYKVKYGEQNKHRLLVREI